MHIVPAGVDEPDSGHFHLLIDTTLKDYNAPIPADENDRHYGKGQTEAAIGYPQANIRCRSFSATRTTSRTTRRCSRR